MSIEALPLHNSIGPAMANLFQETSSLVHALAKNKPLQDKPFAQQAHALGGLNVEGKFFTSHGFISLATRTTSILSWILRESILKPKRVLIHKNDAEAHGPKLMAI